MSDKKIHKTSIGGQAVMEGVMMRGPKEIAIAVRKPDKEIIIEKRPISSVLQKSKILKLPIIRGCIAFFESMITGVKALMFSAEFFDIACTCRAAEESYIARLEPSDIFVWVEIRLELSHRRLTNRVSKRNKHRTAFGAAQSTVRAGCAAIGTDDVEIGFTSRVRIFFSFRFFCFRLRLG